MECVDVSIMGRATVAPRRSVGVDSARLGKLLFFVTEDWYFCSHRLPLAVEAKSAGFDVVVVTRVRDHGDAITCAGLTLIPFEMKRGGVNPLRELRTLLQLIRLYRRERPSLVHHVGVKPILYGAIAAKFSGVSHVVNALAGMGWLFVSEWRFARILRPWVRSALARLLRKGCAIVQNSDDMRLLAQMGVPPRQIQCVAGSGVDLQRFTYAPEVGDVPAVVLPARLLWDKGVGEFVLAAQELRRRGIKARFVLAGRLDAENPSSVSQSQLEKWIHSGAVEFFGWIDNMPKLLSESHVVCLPSYREGMPKALLEAAASGRPIVTTDVPGCRETVVNELNGLLVSPRDVPALVTALHRMLTDRGMRQRMGLNGRAIAESRFGIASTVERMLKIYRDVLNGDA